MKLTEIESERIPDSYINPVSIKVAATISIALTVIAAVGALYFGLTAGVNSLIFIGLTASSIAFFGLSIGLIVLYVKNKACFEEGKAPLQETKKIYLSVDKSDKNNLSLKKEPFSSEAGSTTTLVFDQQKCLVLNDDSLATLKSNSPYLNTMFSGNFKESDADKIKLKNQNRDLLIEILRDLSSNAVEMTDNIVEKFQLASFLQMDAMIEKYRDCISKNFNCFELEDLLDNIENLDIQEAMETYLNQLLNTNLYFTNEFERIIKLLIDKKFKFNSLKFNGRFDDGHLKLLSGISCKNLDLSRTLLRSLEGINNIKELSSLNISDTKISNLNPLEELHLVELDLFYCHKIHPESFSSIALLKELKKLNLSSTFISNIHFLKEMTDLEILFLNHSYEISAESFAVLSNCKKIKELDLRDTRISNIDFLKEMTDLEILFLNHSYEISAESFAVLSNCKKIKELDLRHTKISNIDFLKEMVKLKKLQLNHCNNIASEKFSVLSHCVNLKVLDLGNTQVSNIDFLEKTTKLKSLVLYNRDIPSQNFLSLSHCKKLKKLDLSYTKISDINFLKEMTDLEDLSLFGCENVPSESFSLLFNCKKLKKLALNKGNISKISFLKEMAELQVVYLGGCSSIPSEEFAILTSCVNLRELDLSFTNVSKIEFLRGMAELNKLFLNSCKNITSENFLILSACVKLQTLDVIDTKISNFDFINNMHLKKFLIDGKNLSWSEMEFSQCKFFKSRCERIDIY